MTVIDRTLEIPSAAEGLVSITNYGDIAVVLRHRDTGSRQRKEWQKKEEKRIKQSENMENYDQLMIQKITK